MNLKIKINKNNFYHNFLCEMENFLRLMIIFVTHLYHIGIKIQHLTTCVIFCNKSSINMHFKYLILNTHL
jgi:hypothetical protein